ncbi:MAG TPA: DNA repair protein RecO [Puia sp.]|nr:DNA repair protein RecO [Puia sp.]
MVQKTKGIVLRTVKYGETSVIVAVLTEMFGLQSYLVNGVRAGSSKGHSKIVFFQPGAILDLVVYHNEIKHLQRIREYQWGYLYKKNFFDVKHHAVSMFLVELLQKCLKQPEVNPELFQFAEDSLIGVDESEGLVLANFPLYFSLHLAGLLGLRIDDNYSSERRWLDLQEGFFSKEKPVHPYFLEEPYSALAADLLKVMQPGELPQVPLNQEKRRILLQGVMDFYNLHIPGFGILKSLPVLRAIIEEGS